MSPSADEDPQQKVRSACEPCHERKIKCEQDQSGGPCVACSSNGRSCFFLPRIKAGRPRRNRSPKQQKASPPSTATSKRNPNPMSDQLGRSWLSSTGRSDCSSIAASLDWVAPSTEFCRYDDSPLLSDGGYNEVPLYSYDCFQDGTPFSTEQKTCPGSIALPTSNCHFDGMPTPVLSHSMTPSASSSVGCSGEREHHDSANSIHLQRRGSTALPSPALVEEQQSHSPWSADSTDTGPQFLDLIRKCSELEMHIGSLETSRDMLFDSTTSAPTYRLHFLLQTVDAASDLIMNVANKAPINEGSSPAATTHAYQYFPEQPVDNISPAALERGHGQVSHPRLIAIEPSLLALCLALAHKLLDVCELMAMVSPRDSLSEVRMLYLKRLDVIVSRVRGALSLIEEGICQDTLTQGGLLRASKIQSQTRATYTQMRHSSDAAY